MGVPAAPRDLMHPYSQLRAALLSLLLLLTCSALVSCTVEAEGPRTLRFTAIPGENTSDLEEKFRPVAAYLEQTLRVPVEYVPVSSYPASVEAFKNGEVQLAWFGGVTGVQARQAVKGASAIAQGRVDPEYRSYFIAHASTGILPSEEFPQGLEGRTFCFGSESSTSGRVMPTYFIQQEVGRAPEDFFSDVRFSGAHDKTALLVSEGAVEAGVLSYKTYETLQAAGKLDPEVCRVVWQTPTYQDYNWTSHPELEELFGEGTTERLRTALLEMDDPQLLAACQRPEGMIAASNEDYAAIAEVLSAMDFIR